MSIRIQEAMRSGREELRHEPTEKRVRALLAGAPVVDSASALLVWEPRRIVPSFAVPEPDVRADLVETAARDGADAPLLHPGIPFAVHSTPGTPLDLRRGDVTLEQAAFRPADPDLGGYVLLDFRAFDEWYEEDEPLFGHARDPFHRIDVRRSTRHVRIERDGRVLAESSRPTLLFETSLPTRFYIPREDVVADLGPSDRRTTCAYKGHASYYSVDGLDLAWTYEDPLLEAAAIKGMIAFFDELVDVTLDGTPRERPVTQFKSMIAG